MCLLEEKCSNGVQVLHLCIYKDVIFYGVVLWNREM